MDLSGPGIDVKLKERKKERKIVHSQNSPSLLHITSRSITGNTSPQNPYCDALNNLGTVWFVEGFIPEAKIWWQPCLGIEYAWSQRDN